MIAAKSENAYFAPISGWPGTHKARVENRALEGFALGRVRLWSVAAHEKRSLKNSNVNAVDRLARPMKTAQFCRWIAVKRPHKFLVIPILSFLGLTGIAPRVAESAAPLPLSCGQTFARLENSDENRISLALGKVLGLGADENLSGELARLDRLLAHEIAASISGLNPKRRTNFLTIIDNVESVLYLNSGAQVRIDRKAGLSVQIDILVTNHPFSRLYLRHEASHLSRLVSDSEGPNAAAAYASNVVNRRLGVYREEVGSFRDQYRFLRNAYTTDDLPRLRKLMPAPSADDIEFLKQKGVLSGSVGGERTITLGNIDPLSEEFSAAVRYMRSEMDGRFVSDVENALTLSQAEYVRGWIKRTDHYTKEQEAQQRVKLKNATLRWLSKIGIVSGSAAGIYYFYDEQ